MNPFQILRSTFVALLALSLISAVGCGDDDDDLENQDPELGDVHSIELLDRDDDGDVAAYVHGDHWHRSPFTLTVDEDRRSIGFRFLDAAEDEVEIPLGDDGWELEVEAADGDVIDINHHGDHVHFTGLEEGSTDLLFDLVKDDETIYSAPELSTIVHSADAEDYETIANVELLDRNDDESVLVYSDDDHWHGSIHLDVDAESHESLGFRFLDGNGDEVTVPLGSDGFDYDIHGYDDDLIYLDTHSDHFHIQGEMEGETELHIEFTKDGDVFYDAAQGDHLQVHIHGGDAEHESIVNIELLDRNDDESVLADSHGNHWHGGLDLDSHACSHESIGFRFLDADDEEVTIPLGSDGFDYEIDGYDDDLIYLNTHSDHFHIQGEMNGHTDLHIEFMKDGEVFYEAAGGDHLHVDIDPMGFEYVTEVDLLDRNDDEEVLVYSDGDHWHGSLELDAAATDHESIGFRLLDDMDEEVCVPLGDDGFSYEIHGYDDDLIYLDTHSDHFHIQGEQVGSTELTIEFTRDGDTFYDAADGDHLVVDIFGAV